jgi:hypothetical protein
LHGLANTAALSGLSIENHSQCHHTDLPVGIDWDEMYSAYTGTSGLAFPIGRHTEDLALRNTHYGGLECAPTSAQTTFNFFCKSLRTPTTFSTSLAIGCSGSDTCSKASSIYEKGHFFSRKIHSTSHRGDGRGQGLRVNLGRDRWFTAQ